MAEILEEKKVSSKIVDALAISGVAVVGNVLIGATPLGSNYLISGGSKIGVGLVSAGFGKSKFMEYVGAGFLVAGSLDLVNGIFGKGINSGLNKLTGAQQTQSSSTYI